MMVGYITELDYGGRHLMVGVLPIEKTRRNPNVDIKDREGLMKERLRMYHRFMVADDFVSFYSSDEAIRCLTVLQEYTDPTRMQKILQELSEGRDLTDVSDDILEGEVRKFFECGGSE